MRRGITVSLVAFALLAEAAPGQSTERSPKAGKVFRDCANCPEMVVIPAGHFQMGAPAGEKGTSPLEQPVHRVSIVSFAAGRFDVTRGEWALFSRATHRPTRKGCSYTGRSGPFLDPTGSWRSTGFVQTDRHPVVCVNWQDATEYAAWLSRRTGKRYRLLSEAEWEYAARGGSSEAYGWGSSADHGNANYGPDTGYGKGLSRGRDRWIHTSPVGSFPANGFGLYDMSGNVLQFVADCLGSYLTDQSNGSPMLRNKPLKLGGDFADLDGMMSCDFRIARGGDWGDPPEMLRSAFRNFSPPPPYTLANFTSTGLGFRVARDLR
jgi:formylglycine-generating enzyme required for sulfatase activity